ncbi:hypothetical protein [Lutimonas vermicola]|uniref:Uncharacterized protein n=1 Tax=Lutimonas vermicola TaxID=414288 RepID=A0ABU9KY14_9FLAO
MLRKSTSFILSVFVLTQSFSIHASDMFKLGSLLDHIEFHQATDGDDIFLFLSKHYGNKMQQNKGETGNDTEHQKLPFNQRLACDSGHLFVFQLEQPVFLFTEIPNAEKRDFYYYNFYSFMENSDIFQPPQQT